MSLLNLPIVSQALSSVQDRLISFTDTPQEKKILETVFGDRFDVEGATSWLMNAVGNDFSDFPNLEIISTEAINQAQGAYSADTNTIYLATEFITQHANNSQAIGNVVLEEFGHFFDSQFNFTDTPGDEGNHFAALLQGKILSDSELTKIKTENDLQTVVLNNQTIEIEQANPGDNPAFDLIGLTQLRNDPQFAGIDGSGFSIAVIDTGIDKEHPLLASNYIAGYDFIDHDHDPSDANGHGTHVSGTIGSRDETIGVATDVDLISLRVLDANRSGSLSKVEAALDWVLANQEEYNITAVNLSLGLGFYSSRSKVRGGGIFEGIQRLEAAGVTVIAATGNKYFTNSGEANQANITFPAITSTLGVGAVWQDGTKSNVKWQGGSIDHTTGADRIVSFSQRLDVPNVVFAPGAFITSTLPGGKIGKNAGTSQASPHVAGTVALLQEASLKFGGDLLTPNQIGEILRSTGDRIVDGDDEDDNVGHTNDSFTRINVYNAVAEVKRRSNSNSIPDTTRDLAAVPSEAVTNLPDLILSSDDIVSEAQVYRFFRPDLGVHFYTASEVEKEFITDNLENYNFEGESYITAKSDSFTGTKPVYRFLNTNTGAHLYTMLEAEKDYINTNLPNYNFEGVAYHGYESDQPGTTPLYRFYNPVVDAHFYTPSEAEKEFVIANLPDYQLENNDGIAFYVEPIVEI